MCCRSLYFGVFSVMAQVKSFIAISHLNKSKWHFCMSVSHCLPVYSSINLVLQRLAQMPTHTDFLSWCGKEPDFYGTRSISRDVDLSADFFSFSTGPVT